MQLLWKKVVYRGWSFGWNVEGFQNKIGQYIWHPLPLLCINVFSQQNSFLDSLTSLQGQLCWGKKIRIRTSKNQMFQSLGPKMWLLTSHGFKLRMAAGVVVKQLLLLWGAYPLSFNDFRHGPESFLNELLFLQGSFNCLIEGCDPPFRGVDS